MSEYFIYSMESTIICLIVFGIMLFHDFGNVDRQEKQIKFDISLVMFMLYFISDAFFAAIDSGVLPKTRVSFTIINFINCVLMAGVTYAWLEFAMAKVKSEHRNRKINKFAVVFPFIVSTLVLLIMFFAVPETLIDGELNLKPAYYVFLVVVPVINIGAALLHVLRHVGKEENPFERKKQYYIAFFPLLVISGGIVQILLLPQTPIFCFGCMILMLILYIYSQETRISIDPLTGLNNRGQLARFLAQKSNYSKKDKLTFVIMFDINGFKKVNDTYGHAEGDQALILIADTLRDIAKNSLHPMFVCRYGGDEFLIVFSAENENDAQELIDDIGAAVAERCRAEGKPYTLSIGAGYAQYGGDNNTIRECIQRADENLYVNKGR